MFKFIFFRFGEVIFDPTTFVVFCLVLRITSAIGAAAAETAVLACTLQKFPNNAGTISVCLHLDFHNTWPRSNYAI